MNYKTMVTGTTAFALCAALAFSAATLWKAPASAGDLNLTAQLFDVNGAAFDGALEVHLAQTRVDAGSGVTTVLGHGPYSGTSVAGILSTVIPSNELNGIDLAKSISVTFWPVGDNGETGAGRLFYLDYSEGVKAKADVVVAGPDQAGEYHAILRNLKLSGAPTYGKVSVQSTQGSHPSITLYIAKDYPFPVGDFGEDTQLETGEVEQLQLAYGANTIYSWSTNKEAGIYVRASDGWGSSSSALLRGSNVSTVNLYPENSVRASFSVTQYPDCLSVVLFDASTYQPFDAAACPPGAANGNAIMRADSDFSEGRMGMTDNGDQSTYIFTNVAAGAYVLEFWTLSGVKAAIPAPDYQTTVTMTGTVPVLVSIP